MLEGFIDTYFIHHSIFLNINFGFNFLPLLIVISTAWILPIVLSLLKFERIPTVIVEIVIGYFIGHFFLSNFTLAEIEPLNVLSLSGFIFLMFLGGLVIDVDQIFASLPKRKITLTGFIKNPLLVGIVYFILSVAISCIGTFILSRFISINNIWYFSLIMVTTSLGIILPVLKNRHEGSSRFGQMIIVAAAVADIIGILLFSFTAFVLKNGFKIEILLILSLFLVFFIFSRIGIYLLKKQILKRITFQLSHTASQIQVRGTIVIILIFVVLAQFVGHEIMLLGAFLAGLLLSILLHKGRSLLLIKLDGIGYGFFIPIFFIMVGAQFNGAVFSELNFNTIIFWVVLLALMFLIKLLPSFLWFKLFGRKKAIAGGFLMASQMSLIIAASQIGLDLGIISPLMNSSFILMAVLTCLISPLLYNFINPIDVLSGDKVIIIGGSSSGVLLARRFKIHGKSSVILESNKKRYLEIRSKGLNIFYGDGLNPETYEKLKLQPSNHVVVLTGSTEEDVKICELLRNEFQHEKIITKAYNLKIENHLKLLNVKFLDIRQVIAATIENFILKPTAYHTLIETFDNFSVEEIKICNTKINRFALSEIPFHKDGSIMLIRRGSQIFIPHGDTFMQVGDVATVLGTRPAIDGFRRILLDNK